MPPRLRVKVLQRNAAPDELLMVEIEHHAEQGGVVVLRRWGGRTVTIVKNGGLWLVRPDPRDDIKGPVGSYATVAQALTGADAYAVPPPPEDHPDDFLPKGAA